VFDNYFMGEFYAGQEDFHPSEKDCHTINNNDYSIDGMRHLREIVGLTGDFTYDQKALEDVQ